MARMGFGHGRTVGRNLDAATATTVFHPAPLRLRGTTATPCSMRYLRDTTYMDEADKGASAAIGNFDGVHLGHLALIQKNLETSQNLGLSPLIYTFEPHPRRILQPDKHPPRIMSRSGSTSPRSAR